MVVVVAAVVVVAYPNHTSFQHRRRGRGRRTQFASQKLQTHGLIQPEFEKNFYDSQLLLLETLEKCLSIQPKETTRYDEQMNVKALLKEICPVSTRHARGFNLLALGSRFRELECCLFACLFALL